MINILLFSVPNEYNVVLQFQNITKVKFQPAAEYVVEVNGWDLDRSIRWYHDRRNDSDMPQDLKAYLYNDYIPERPGTFMSTLLLSGIFIMYILSFICERKIVDK